MGEARLPPEALEIPGRRLRRDLVRLRIRRGKGWLLLRRLLAPCHGQVLVLAHEVPEILGLRVVQASRGSLEECHEPLRRG